MAAVQSTLENYAQLLIERNVQLHALMQQIDLDSIQKKDGSTQNKASLYDRVILTESDWNNFQHHFNKVYPNFISDLRTQYPSLTPAELRLILLDKMGLSLKETSSILGTSIDAVKKGRYRLKKKYNLDEENLSDMI